MKKPYIKKHSKVSEFTVWVVDGKYIRDKIDIRFTSYGQNYLFKFIPKNEFWLDKERTPNEDKYYINSLLRMNRFMAAKMNHKKAVKKDNELEKIERLRDYLKENRIKDIKKLKIVPKMVHKKLLKKYSGKVKVWVVDGKKVRDLFYVEFTEGGHDKVYSFIPKNEVWIDDDDDEKEVKLILLHEMHERKLMAKGMKYDPAHERAHKLERHYRQNPKGIDENLKQEIEENNRID